MLLQLSLIGGVSGGFAVGDVTLLDLAAKALNGFEVQRHQTEEDHPLIIIEVLQRVREAHAHHLILLGEPDANKKRVLCGAQHRVLIQNDLPGACLLVCLTKVLLVGAEVIHRYLVLLDQQFCLLLTFIQELIRVYFFNFISDIDIIFSQKLLNLSSEFLAKSAAVSIQAVIINIR